MTREDAVRDIARILGCSRTTASAMLAGFISEDHPEGWWPERVSEKSKSTERVPFGHGLRARL